MGSLSDKVRKARILASKPKVRAAARETAARNAKSSGMNLTPKEETKAAKVLSSRMQIDRSRTASRAVSIAKTQAKKNVTKRLASATGSTSEKKVTPKDNKKKLTKSEQNFLDGQKLKKKILKDTGVYKNTAT